MKILHVGEYVKGGVSTYVNELISFQKNQSNVEVFLALSDHNSDESFRISNDNIYRYNYSRKPLSIVKGLFHINNILKQTKPDIVHIHSTFAGIMMRSLLFLKKRNFKVVYTPHGWSFIMEVSKIQKRIYAFIETILYLKTDKIINISKYEYERALEFKVPSKKSIIIYSGVRDAYNKEKINLELDNEKVNLLFIGRYDKAKGLDIILELFRKNSIANVQLYVVGASVLSDIQISVPQNVFELGWVNQEDIDAYIKEFDALIIPSRWEGFGLVALEAMRNKKAVIASNRAALPELVIDGLNGKIVNLDSEDDMLNVIKNIKKNDLKSMGLNGYKIFRENYSSKVMNEKIIEIYRQLKKK
ncbi:glycosyltransferase [Priestia aryabhattai]|uniref:glycosyltransferase n=1 Tax=Priestia aryabhattai TaxID=412384 RepID=UPI003D287AAC